MRTWSYWSGDALTNRINCFFATRGWVERKESSSQQRIDGFGRRKKRDLMKEIQRVSLWIGIKDIFADFGGTVHGVRLCKS